MSQFFFFFRFDFLSMLGYVHICKNECHRQRVAQTLKLLSETIEGETYPYTRHVGYLFGYIFKVSLPTNKRRVIRLSYRTYRCSSPGHIPHKYSRPMNTATLMENLGLSSMFYFTPHCCKIIIHVTVKNAYISDCSLSYIFK